MNRTRQIKTDNERLGLEVELLKEQLEREEMARCQAEQELLRVNKEKQELESVMQGVQCTVYRAEGGERPYLVAKITSPNKDLVSGFCNDLRNLKIIEDYYCTTTPDGHDKKKRRSNRTPRARRLTAGIGDEGWTNLFVEGCGSANETDNTQRQQQNGTAAKRRRRKRTDSVTIEDGDGGDRVSAPQENGDDDCESDCEEPPEGEMNGNGSVATHGADDDHSSEDYEEDDVGVVDGDVEECLIRRAASQGDKSACEAALALRNEVVTLELSSDGGSWRLPVHFAACLNLLGHYLKDYGVIPSFKWPYSSASFTQEKTAHAAN